MDVSGEVNTGIWIANRYIIFQGIQVALYVFENEAPRRKQRGILRVIAKAKPEAISKKTDCFTSFAMTI